MIFISNNGRVRGGGLGCLIFGVLGLVAAFFLLKWFFQFLWWAAPVLFVLALAINWRSVANTGRQLFELLMRDPVRGILFTVLAIVGFPLFAAYLFLQALGGRVMERQLKNMFGEQAGRAPRQPTDEYVDYEEIESTPKKPTQLD